MFNLIQSSLLKAGNIESIDSVSTKIKEQRANPVFEAQAKSSIYNNKSLSINKEKLTGKKATLGKGWFDLQPMEMDDSLKRDIQMIQMRNYMDPKRFYKNPDKVGPILHIGTVVEGPSEYKSSRVTKKDRKSSITEEILADADVKKYSKRVLADIQKVKQNKKKVYRVHKKDSKNKKSETKPTKKFF